MTEIDVGSRVPIPKRIHRIWLRDAMPDAFTDFGERWRELHPEWEFKDWRDPEEVARLRLPGQRIRERAREVIPRDWKRFEADVLRLELLHSFGGLYVDTDVEPHRNVEGLLNGRVCVVGRSPQAKDGYHAITNCVMASVRGHRWIWKLLDRLEHSMFMHQKKPLAQMIGPWHLDRVYGDGSKWPTVTVLSPDEMFQSGWLTHHWNTARRKRGKALG